MTKKKILNTWDRNKVTAELKATFKNGSELELLAILKSNSFLFYELVERKRGVQPIFHEINFGGGLRCDFVWLNDRSDGPEWVLVEVERPGLGVFKKDNEPTHELNHAIEQIKSWRRYFNENTAEKRRIFGAVARFRFILIAGDKNSWALEKAAKWRIDNNKETKIEIRSMEVFHRALKVLEDHPEELWSFAENPKTLPPSSLQNYWEKYDYMDDWRKLLN